MKYIDIGLNLFSEQYRGEEEEIYRTALANSTAFIITGSSMRSSAEAARFAEGRENVWSTVGVHPHDARHWDEKSGARMRELAAKKCNVAIGECGLDYDRMFSPKDVQLKVFEEQLRIAEELDKPLFLHERDADEDFARLLKAYPDRCKKAVVHCFTGSRKTAEKYLELGCMIGITGWVCDDRRNAEVTDALKIIPIERLMAETDGPYLKPRNVKLKGANRPEYIRYVVEKIADIKQTDEEELRKILMENTRRFFEI